MLRSADNVRNFHIEVIDDVCQVVERRTVGALNHVIGFLYPGHFNLSAYTVLKNALPIARHLESNDTGSSLRLETCLLCRRLRHPFATVLELPFFLFSSQALAFHFFL